MKLPTKWPVSLETFLRLVVRRRHPDRMPIYKQFISDGMRFEAYKLKHQRSGMEYGDAPSPSQDEVESAVAQHSKEGFSKGLFLVMAEEFRKWEPNILKRRAQTAAGSSWSEAARKKRAKKAAMKKRLKRAERC